MTYKIMCVTLKAGSSCKFWKKEAKWMQSWPGSVCSDGE